MQIASLVERRSMGITAEWAPEEGPNRHPREEYGLAGPTCVTSSRVSKLDMSAGAIRFGSTRSAPQTR